MKMRMGMAVLGVGLMLIAPGVWAQSTEAPAAAPALIPADQQASKEQLAKLFELMRIKQQLAATTRTIPGMMQQQIHEQLQEMQKENPQLNSLTGEQQEAVKKLVGQYMERASTLYGPDEMIADLTAVYQKHLSRPDVESTIAFYSTPAGQHLIDMTPAMMQEFMPLVMKKTQDRMQPLVLQMQKEMVEATAQGASKPSQK